MNRNQARKTLKLRLKDYVQNITSKSKGTNMYVCPYSKTETEEQEKK